MEDFFAEHAGPEVKRKHKTMAAKRNWIVNASCLVVSLTCPVDIVTLDSRLNHLGRPWLGRGPGCWRFVDGRHCCHMRRRA